MDAEEVIRIIKSNYPPENYTMLREALDSAILIVGTIRSGDADAISEILSLLEEIADISKEDRELLTRYRDMAQAMEAHR